MSTKLMHLSLQTRHQVYWRHDLWYRRSWIIVVQTITIAVLYSVFVEPLPETKIIPNAKWIETTQGEANYEGFTTCMNEKASIRDRGEACDRLLKNSFLSRNDLARAYYGRALKEEDEGKLDYAILDLTSSIEFNPNKVMFFLRGEVFQKQLKFTEAREDYQKSLAMDMSYAEPHVGLGRIYLQEGSLDKAEAEFAIAIGLKPKLPTAHYYLGQYYLSKKNFDAAAFSFSTAISSSEAAPAMYYASRAEAYLRQNRLQLARLDIDKAKTISNIDKKLTEVEPKLLEAEFMANSKYAPKKP